MVPICYGLTAALSMQKQKLCFLSSGITDVNILPSCGLLILQNPIFVGIKSTNFLCFILKYGT